MHKSLEIKVPTTLLSILIIPFWNGYPQKLKQNFKIQIIQFSNKNNFAFNF